jgi:hypothetical protein
MTREPYAVQIAALKASNGARGFNYFMEQGLGKTGTAYMDFLERVAEGNVTRMVVVCPNSFKGGWGAEAIEWGFDVDVFVYESGNDWDNDKFLKKKYDKPPVLVINYDALRPKITGQGKAKRIVEGAGMEYVRKFIAGRNCFLTIDESIQISTHDAAQTIGVIMLAKEFSYVRNLSGKSIKLGPQDLWSQMRAIGELEGRNYYSFKTMFCRMGGFKGKKVIGSQNEDVLEELLAPHTFRATKADWTDLPPKVWGTREYQLGPDLARHYKTMFDEFVVWLEDGSYVTIEAAITKYMKLAQIQSGFIFDEKGGVQWLVPPTKNGRLKALREYYEDEVTGKLIVVYNHKPIRELLADAFTKENPAFIRGGMTTEEVEAEKRRFNNDDSCRIIFITKAAKYGHTLLGNQKVRDHSCSNMAFFENTYSLDDRGQLEDRPHRHGQLQEMMNYMDFVATPLDREMIKGLQTKEAIFQTIFRNIRSYRP